MPVIPVPPLPAAVYLARTHGWLLWQQPMKCGWGRGAAPPHPQMRAHFTICPKRSAFPVGLS
jgi:hypothetical protein